MPKRILVTDSLFIHDTHVAVLEQAGYDVVRLDTPSASEDQLIDAVAGASAYILGGVEKVTEAVFAAAKDLEVIVFTGADWMKFMPGHAVATARGIAIASTPGVNAQAVAEWTVGAMVMMRRQLRTLGAVGGPSFLTTPSVVGATVAVIGLGAIGQQVARSVLALGAKEVVYWSRTRKPDVEEELGLRYAELTDAVAAADIVTLHASSSAGQGYFGSEQVSAMQDGALLVDASFDGAVDADALLEALRANRISAALDHPLDDRFAEIPADILYVSNASTAFNTSDATARVSEEAVQVVLNVLVGKPDDHVVNR